MKILVCGGREFADKEFLYHFLDELLSDEENMITHVIHGGAHGADRLAHSWAVSKGIQPVECIAIWRARDIEYNARAGLERNLAMLALKPDIVIAFPGGRGTAHMCRIATAAGVPVTRAIPAGFK